MGVLNVTPDSFYDGGRYQRRHACENRIDGMIAEGARFIDIGAESSRPGAAPVPPEEQTRRLEAALAYAVERGDTVVSVDTTSAEVAEFCLERGARMINDVSCLGDVELARVVADHGATLILMHARLPMSQMEGYSRYPENGYDDVVRDVASEWSAARDRAVLAGLAREAIWFDPGLGFSKSARQSYQILSRLADFRSLGVPIVVGASRKSFIAKVDGSGPEQRLGGSIAAAVIAAQRGANLLRVHDVYEARQALGVAKRAAAIEARHV
jgi:dihydropteroate synthase